MNYFVEGLQGSGKSTLTGKLSEKYPDHKSYHEGDHSPVELAWCAYVSREKYEEILCKYSEIRPLIEAESFAEDGQMIICYTQVKTDISGFYQDLEQYEIYNNRRDPETFRRIILGRYRRWNGDKAIFECSLLQNIVEDMILFRVASDEKIMDLYREIRDALEGKAFHIVYLRTDDIAGNIGVIRKERSDEQGNELWFPMMLGYFNSSPFALKHGLSGEDALLNHLRHRQDLELRICQEIFPDRHTVLRSKEYTCLCF